MEDMTQEETEGAHARLEGQDSLRFRKKKSDAERRQKKRTKRLAGQSKGQRNRP